MMTKHKKHLSLVLLALIAVFAAPVLFLCHPTYAKAAELATYYFDESTVYLRAGEQTTLSIHCSDASVATANLKILWSSSNDSVVKVDNGKITTLIFGEATITASIVTPDGTAINKTCLVIVTNPTLTEEQQNVTAHVYETIPLSISTINANEHVTWASLNESIATVDTIGKVTGVTSGTTNVTATIGAGSDAVVLTYTINILSPSIEGTTPSVYMGQTTTLQLAYVSSVAPVWSSANTKIATIDKNTGVVKGKDAGTVKITATVGDYKATVKLTVKSKLVEQPHVTAILKIVNHARKKNGKKPLTAEHHLTQAANARAKEISRKFSHIRPNGSTCFTILKKYKVSYTSAGENIAYGQTSPKKVMKSWMGSRDHRKNILSGKYHNIGIGRYKKGNKIYWVQMFTD